MSDHAERQPAKAGSTEPTTQRQVQPSGQISRMQQLADHSPQALQLKQQTEAIAPPNRTGLPDQLKSGIESLSGMSMDHVKVHYNSSKPAQLQAHAYAQGSDIHVGPGQERHLPHEAWHVVQQAQGRVRPTLQMKAGTVNDDPSLEKEADIMGGEAAQFKGDHGARNLVVEERVADPATQRIAGFSKRPAAITVQSQQKTNATNAILQGYFTYGPQLINSAEKARAKFIRSTLGSSKVKPAQKEALLTERWQALQDLADSTEDQGKVANLTQLKGMIASYVNAQKVIAAGIPTFATSSSGKPTVSVSRMLETGSVEELPEELRMIVKALMESNRAFPYDNILTAAKSATSKNGGGFFVELKLAKQIIDSRSDVYVQFGVMRPSDIEISLGFVPTASTIATGGLVGGDLAVWERPPEKGRNSSFKNSFIQSKTANKGTVRTNVLAASNQLAGLTASGAPIGKHAEREFTYTGPLYEGVIYVEIIENVDPTTLDKVAAEAIQANPNYVSRVVYSQLGNSYHEYDAKTKKGTESSTNALFEEAGDKGKASEADAMRADAQLEN